MFHDLNYSLEVKISDQEFTSMNYHELTVVDDLLHLSEVSINVTFILHLQNTKSLGHLLIK